MPTSDTSIFEASRDPILIVRREDGRILNANQAAVKAYGYTRDEFLSKTIIDLRENTSEVTAQLSQADREGILFETTHRKKTGSLFPVEVSSQGATISGVRVLISIIRDTTKRRHAEEEARSLAQFPAENPNPVMRVNSEGRILYQNPPAREFLREIKCHANQSLPSHLFPKIPELISSGSKAETEVSTPNGKFYLFVISPNTKGLYANIYGLDITSRKRAEEALRESEVRFRAISEAAFDGVILHGDGIILEINEAFAQMYGYQVPELIGKPLLHLYDAGSHEIIRRNVASGSEEPYEVNAIRKDGSRFVAEVRGRDAIYRGKKVRAGTHRDITERRKAEDNLRKTAELLSMAQRTGRVGVFDWDLANRESNWTSEMEDIIGLRLGPGMKPRYKLWAQRVHPSDLKEIEALFESWINTDKEEGRWEYRLLKDGEERWISSRGRIIRNAEGKALRMIGTILDVTERKRAEEDLKRSREALRVANEELEEKVRKRSEKLVELVQKLQEENVRRHQAEEELKKRAAQLRALAGELTLTEQRERKRLSGILHDHLQQVLAAAKLEVASLDERDPVNLQNSIKEIESLLNDSLQIARTLSAELSPPILHEGGLKAGLEWLSRWMEEKHGLRVDINSQKDRFALTEDIRVLIFESVRELLFNVVKHSGVKTATVGVRENAEMLVVEVTDPGLGFNPAELEKMGAGAGFGLFSIMERIELIGGKIEIRSAPGQGSCISICAPLAVAEAESPVTAMRLSEHIEKSVGELGRIRLLLVDDHPIIREGLARLLSQEPDIIIVGQANDGLEAIKQASDLSPDIVLMDISMPKLNGIEATKIITKQNPTVRVIGLSMYEEADRAKEMINAGAIKFLSKSEPAAKVKDAIRACVK